MAPVFSVDVASVAVGPGVVLPPVFGVLLLVVAFVIDVIGGVETGAGPVPLALLTVDAPLAIGTTVGDGVGVDC